MLSLYGSFTVPGVPDVVIYRDDETPRKFYMVAGKPRILRSDPRDPASRPMLDLIAYVRDLDRVNPATEDVERGMLQMTVGLEVSQADQANELFETLMGDVVDPRREFIQDNALKVVNLDV